MTTTNSNNDSINVKPKKPKTEDTFEVLKQYLLECPHVAADHPAMKAALEGLQTEQLRRQRDAKLQRKFSSPVKNTSAVNNNQVRLEDSLVVVDNDNPTSGPASVVDVTSNDSDELMEWQDVEDATHNQKKEDEDTTSFLGKKLAKVAIDALSEFHVQVSSPVTAIAVALHAALRSDVLGFSCTGITEDKPTNGFAPPVRELPKNQFLPQQWKREEKTKVALRYRKQGTGALVLTVEQDEDFMITIRLQPSTSKEPSTQSMSFPLQDHMNLDSWNAASSKNAANVVIPPALHYKSLSVLLTNFCRTFDLGSIDEQETKAVAPYVDNTVQMTSATTTVSTTRPIHRSDFVAPHPIPTTANERRREDDPNFRYMVPSTLDQAFPGIHPSYNSGDFASDLAPAGLRDPRFASPAGPGLGMGGGNLLGPNHPMFSPDGSLRGGPGTMQPRFDPVVPPGIDPETGMPRRGNPNNGRRLRGEPNPDHLPPPNSFGNDMFS